MPWSSPPVSLIRCAAHFDTDGRWLWVLQRTEGVCYSWGNCCSQPGARQGQWLNACPTPLAWPMFLITAWDHHAFFGLKSRWLNIGSNSCFQINPLRAQVRQSSSCLSVMAHVDFKLIINHHKHNLGAHFKILNVDNMDYAIQGKVINRTFQNKAYLWSGAFTQQCTWKKSHRSTNKENPNRKEQLGCFPHSRVHLYTEQIF